MDLTRAPPGQDGGTTPVPVEPDRPQAAAAPFSPELSGVADLLGAEAATKLAEHFPGAWYYLATERYAGPLPGLLADIDRVIGRELTLKFARAFGGRRVYVPAKADNPNGPIPKVIGLTATAKLIEQVACGENLHVPLGPMDFRAMRQQRIRSLLVQGLPTSEVARLCGVGERTVWLNKQTLREFGVLRSNVTGAAHDALVARAKVMLLEDTRPDDVARHLGLGAPEVAELRQDLVARGAIRVVNPAED